MSYYSTDSYEHLVNIGYIPAEETDNWMSKEEYLEDIDAMSNFYDSLVEVDEIEEDKQTPISELTSLEVLVDELIDDNHHEDWILWEEIPDVSS